MLCWLTHQSEWLSCGCESWLSTVIITDAVIRSHDGSWLRRFRNIMIWIFIILSIGRLHHHVNWRNLAERGYYFFQISCEVLLIHFLNTVPSVTTSLIIESEGHFARLATGLPALALCVGEATDRVSRLLTVLFEWGVHCRITESWIITGRFLWGKFCDITIFFAQLPIVVHLHIHLFFIAEFFLANLLIWRKHESGCGSRELCLYLGCGSQSVCQVWWLWSQWMIWMKIASREIEIGLSWFIKIGFLNHVYLSVIYWFNKLRIKNCTLIRNSRSLKLFWQRMLLLEVVKIPFLDLLLVGSLVLSL